MKTPVAAAVLLCVLALPGLAATYYVNGARGDDASAGASPESAWKTLDKANASLMPGDTCLVRGGVYAATQIAPARSGTAEARITYAAYRNEKPEVTGGKSGAIVFLNNRSYVTVKGFRIHSPAEHDWTVSVAGADARYNRVEGCDVTDPQGYVCIDVADGASYNEIVGNTCHDTGHGDEQSGDCIVLNQGAHHNTIVANRCYNACHSQILVLKGSKNNVIQDNECYSTDPKWAGAGIDVVRNADSNVVRGNRIHDLGAITMIKDAIQIDSANNTVDHNVIYNCARFGIWLESMDFRGEGQEAKNNLIANNTVYNCGRQGLYVNFKRGFITADNRFVNNIVTGSPEVFEGLKASILIVYTDRAIDEMAPSAWFGNVFRNNLFWHEKAGEPGMALYRHKNGTVTWSLPELEKAFPENFSGNIEVKPEFVDVSKGDFRLVSGSPLIDAGLDVGLAFEGKAPDVGAVESVAPATGQGAR